MTRFFILIVSILPVMAFFAGCLDDKILDAIKEERDYIAPFDVTESDAIDTAYFAIPDTGKTGSSIAGDDASYINVPGEISLDHQSLPGGDVVADNTTGLMWTRCTASGEDAMDSGGCTAAHSKLVYSDAESTCENLDYGGYTDWRLPHLHELFSIVNFGQTDPSIDTTVFPNTENAVNEGYWSQTSKSFFGDNKWVIFFKSSNPQWNAFFGDVNNIADFKSPSELHYVRCVRNMQ